jgi:hypothetical protein
MYFTGFFQGEVSAIGWTDGSIDVTGSGAAFSLAVRSAILGREAINTGLADTELPVIATAESNAAIVLSQAFRTTGSLLEHSGAGIHADD